MDHAEEDDDELRQGLKMMEEEMGQLDGNEDIEDATASMQSERSDDSYYLIVLLQNR
jgi:hypothetical protein